MHDASSRSPTALPVCSSNFQTFENSCLSQAIRLDGSQAADSARFDSFEALRAVMLSA